MRKNINNPRKGFSIMEVIVALVVITLVSVVVMTIIKSANKVEEDTMSVIEATTITENIIECFRYADTKEEFDALLQKFVDSYEFDYNAENLDRYVIYNGLYRITFVINYVADELEINTVVDGKEIYSYIYTKE